MSELTAAQFADLPWQPVQSSHIAQVAWLESGHPLSGRDEPVDDENDDRLGALYVQFLRGKTARYLDVSKLAAERVMEADSVGRALHAVVKSEAEFEYIDIGEQ